MAAPSHTEQPERRVVSEVTELVFKDDLEPKTLPVKFKRKDGTVLHFVLREADEAASCAYMRTLSESVQVSPDGKKSIDAQRAKDALLANSLYQSENGTLPLDGNGNADRSKLVTLDFVLALRPGVADLLKDWLEENSYMGPPDTVERLKSQIANLQERLKILEKDEREEAVDPSKN